MNKKIMRLSLLSLLLLTGCSNDPSASPVPPSSSGESSSLPSSSTPSSSSSSTAPLTTHVPTNDELMVGILETLAEQGFSLSGTSTRIREYNNPYYSLNNTEFDSEDVIIVSEDAYSFTSEREDGETSSRKAFRGEDGLVSEEYLDYKNERSLRPVVDDLGNGRLYETEYGNPFADISRSDLTKGEDGVYTLSGKKAQVFAHKLLGEDLEGDIQFTLENRELKRISSEGLTGTEYFVSTGVYTTLDVTLSFDYTIDTKPKEIELLEPSTNENTEIANLLKGIENGFRFDIVDDSGMVTASTYFNGEEILFQYLVPDAPMPFVMDMYLYPNAEGTMDLKWYNITDEETGAGEWVENNPEETDMYYTKVTYAQLASDIAHLSPAVFRKQLDGTYVPVDTALKTIGENIIPYIYDALGIVSYDDFRFQCTGCIVKTLDTDGDEILDAIEFDLESHYSNGGAATTVTVNFRFSDIGSCTFPYIVE